MKESVVINPGDKSRRLMRTISGISLDVALRGTRSDCLEEISVCSDPTVPPGKESDRNNPFSMTTMGSKVHKACPQASLSGARRTKSSVFPIRKYFKRSETCSTTSNTALCTNGDTFLPQACNGRESARSRSKTGSGRINLGRRPRSSDLVKSFFSSGEVESHRDAATRHHASSNSKRKTMTLGQQNESVTKVRSPVTVRKEFSPGLREYADDCSSASMLKKRNVYPHMNTVCVVQHKRKIGAKAQLEGHLPLRLVPTRPDEIFEEERKIARPSMTNMYLSRADIVLGNLEQPRMDPRPRRQRNLTFRRKQDSAVTK